MNAARESVRMLRRMTTPLAVLAAGLALGGCSDELAPSVEKFSVTPECGVLLDLGGGDIGFRVDCFARGTGGNTSTDGLKHTWDMGDGTMREGQSFPHVYRSPGTYTVTLRVADDDGDEDTSTLEIEVIDEAAAMSVSSAILSGPDPVAGGFEVSFNAETQWGCPVERPLDVQFRYDWDFGDGETRLNQSNPVHTYAEANSYTATVTVRELTTNVVVVQNVPVDIPAP